MLATPRPGWLGRAWRKHQSCRSSVGRSSASGHPHVYRIQRGRAGAQVYRMAAEDIGCSLAEAAEAPPYDAYLAGAQAAPGPALHVVYINTSLRTKARAHTRVPTITCTSSNVVQTVLQAFAQVHPCPRVHPSLHASQQPLVTLLYVDDHANESENSARNHVHFHLNSYP